MQKHFLIFSLFFLLTHISYAGITTQTGKQLLENCKVALDIYDKNVGYAQTEDDYTQGAKTGICEGYLMSNNEMHPAYCLPDNYNLLIGAAIVVKYLKNHPEEENSKPSAIISKVFKTYFPCDGQVKHLVLNKRLWG